MFPELGMARHLVAGLGWKARGNGEDAHQNRKHIALSPCQTATGLILDFHQSTTPKSGAR